jgi:hypothetical protein
MVIGTATRNVTITNNQSTGNSELFGAYYASIPKMTTKTGKKFDKRDPIDKARIVLLRQLVTAKLNCCAFGCSSSIQGMIATADANYASDNRSAILASAGELDIYNNSGDTIILDPAPGHATPKTSSDWADKDFWNDPSPW